MDMQLFGTRDAAQYLGLHMTSVQMKVRQARKGMPNGLNPDFTIMRRAFFLKQTLDEYKKARVGKLKRGPKPKTIVAAPVVS